MSLTDFKPQFDNAYEETFNKVLVAKAIMNTRFQSTMKFGESLERVSYDISAVVVRAVTRGAASTIDTITDSAETLLVNLEYETVFHISDGEVTQAGPLNPGEVIGGQVAQKIAAHLDAKCFAEVLNAAYDFDTGDLTTLSSSGTPITLSSTTVPQLITRMAAKLRYRNNQTGTNLALVIDGYAAGDIEQYLLGKQFSVVESVFKNGYAGPISQAEVFVSENLTGETLVTATGTAATNDTYTIGGVAFTLVVSPVSAGEVTVGATSSASLTNLVAAINDPSTASATYKPVSTANAATLVALGLTASKPTATTMKIVGVGSGRLITSESMSNHTETYNLIHAYFGKKGAIDLVVQDIKPVDMRVTADRRGTNVFSSYLAGLKTFTDGSKKFLDLLIAV